MNQLGEAGEERYFNFNNIPFFGGSTVCPSGTRKARKVSQVLGTLVAEPPVCLLSLTTVPRTLTPHVGSFPTQVSVAPKEDLHLTPHRTLDGALTRSRTLKFFSVQFTSFHFLLHSTFHKDTTSVSFSYLLFSSLSLVLPPPADPESKEVLETCIPFSTGAVTTLSLGDLSIFSLVSTINHLCVNEAT